MSHKFEKGNLCLSLVAGIIISISAPMDVSAQESVTDVATKRCLKLPSLDSKEQAQCTGCVLMYLMTNVENPDMRCKAYSSLNTPVASQLVKAIDPAEIEREVADQMAACDRNFARNCQCWEKEYRENRANGLGRQEAQSTSLCYSKDRIKAYAYPRCVKAQWKMIEQFESYCGCVAEDFSASIIEHGEFNEMAAFRDAAKACNLSQQERLTPERGKERYEKYGRRGPAPELQAYRKVL